ncbi:MAG: carbohydrate-binding protein [Planctomycetes bacterium]|nr:carbohydrate-binding protein [Planctomycetota bacterium]
MRKSIVPGGEPDRSVPADEWLDLERVAWVEVSSEAPDHPVEAALIPVRGVEWRAGGPGPQTVRLVFDGPRPVRRVWLRFAEPSVARIQEFVLRWATGDVPRVMREVVRQQWTFDPRGSVLEIEDYRVELPGVAVLELSITPDISGGEARASLAELRVA